MLMWREGRIPIPPRHLWPVLIGMAVSGVLLFNSLVYLALSGTTSVNASLINSATPIFTLFIAAGLGAERLSVQRLTGAGIGVLGVAWIVSRGSLDVLLSLSFNRGDAVMLFAALLWAVYTVLGGRAMRELSPLVVTTVCALIALPVQLVAGGYELLSFAGGASELTSLFTPVIIIGVLYVGLAPSVVAFLTWNAGVARIGASRGAIFLNLVPLFTAILAVPVLGERITLAQVLGGLFVLLSVWIVNRAREKGR